MTSAELAPDVAALTNQAETIQAMREEGERRVAELRERAVSTWSGYPPKMQDGPHWLRWKRDWHTGSAPGPTFLADWSTLGKRWAYFGVSPTDDAESIARECDYVGPCVQPMPDASLSNHNPCDTPTRTGIMKPKSFILCGARACKFGDE